MHTCNATCVKFNAALCCIKYELDGALSNDGCDVICLSLPPNVIYFVELKGGNLTLQDSKDAIDQIEKCERGLAIDRNRIKIVKLLIHERRGRIDQLAVQELRRRGVSLLKIYETVGEYKLLAEAIKHLI